MKAMKKMLMFNLFLAAMGSVALAEGNANTVTCVSDGSAGGTAFKERQVLSMTFDEYYQQAHVEEYRAYVGPTCGGALFVRQTDLQNTEDDQLQLGCGYVVVRASIGSLRIPYAGGLRDGDIATLANATSSTKLQCFNGAINDLEDFLNRRN